MGVYYGVIDVKHQHRSGRVITETGMLPYPLLEDGVSLIHGHVKVSSIALTPHHIITVDTRGRLTFINRISRKEVQREHIEFGVSGRVLAHSSRASFSSSLIIKEVSLRFLFRVVVSKR